MKARRHPLPAFLAVAVSLAVVVGCQAGRTGTTPPQGGPETTTTVIATVPQTFSGVSSATVVLGRPTGTSITLNVLTAEDARVSLAYGSSAASLTAKTGEVSLKTGEPQEIELTGLTPDTRYYYRLADSSARTLADGRFQTQRAPDSTFTFEAIGDSHPERRSQFDQALYVQTLRSIAADRPDFMLTSGDDFSVDTLKNLDQASVAERYALQRPYLSLVGGSSALFLVNGNHEQAAACNLNGTPNNVAVWAQNARNALYPQPAPNAFYTGDSTEVPYIGLLRDYYAWTWGDALFVVIDPYWHSTVPVDNVIGAAKPVGGGKAGGKAGGGQRRTVTPGNTAPNTMTAPPSAQKTADKWAITLGDEQYAWLQKTLETSNAKYKFVFTHHVLGTGRGGVEEAGLYEWGGRNADGSDGFAQHRPGWDLPIQQLMAKTRVTIFFQGHDHVFAKQELDGVVYQELPNPADPNYAADQASAYRSGDVLPSSGRVRVTVSPDRVHVEYVRSYLPKDATAAHPDGEVAYAYDIPSR